MIGNTFFEFECSYDEGYVAFIDMLGFKNFVQSTNSDDIFAYYMSLNGAYQLFVENGMSMAVFSDSIIITSNSASTKEFISACFYIGKMITSMTDLQVRGGIAYGKYYCKDNIGFGPAIIDAYLCEEQTKLIRIGVAKSAVDKLQDSLQYCFDYDKGSVSLNQYIYSAKAFDKPEKLVEYAKIEREEIIALLQKYQGSDVYEKYKWLAKSYNNFCDYEQQFSVTIDKINI